MKPGDQVKVVKATTSSMDPNFLGLVGEIVEPANNDYDYRVWFPNVAHEAFFEEELSTDLDAEVEPYPFTFIQ
jgi:hypothetical protein